MRPWDTIESFNGATNSHQRPVSNLHTRNMAASLSELSKSLRGIESSTRIDAVQNDNRPVIVVADRKDIAFWFQIARRLSSEFLGSIGSCLVVFISSHDDVRPMTLR